MKFQRDSYSCAVFAIKNALEALGLNYTEKKIRTHTGTSKQGTTEHGIKQAIECLGHNWEELSSDDFKNILKDLVLALSEGKSAILCTQHGDHWVAAIGLCGQRVIVFDSQRTVVNKANNGIHSFDQKQLRRIWTPCNGVFYALAIRP